MVERETGGILANQHESGAAGVFIAAKPPKDALCQASFARAKFTGQEKHIAGEGTFPQQPSDRLGLLRAVRCNCYAMLAFRIHSV